MPDDRLSVQYTALPQQQEAARLGMWAFLATEVLFFGGLMLVYFAYRTAYPDDFAEAARHTKIIIGAANTALLLTSSFAVAWAVTAARSDQARMAQALLWTAALVGIIFLLLKGYEYKLEYDERLVPGLNFSFTPQFAPGAELFFTFYFIATGLHAVHLIIGVAVLLVIGRKAGQGGYSANYNSPITVAGLYWHFIDAIWIVLFALIYLPGRNGS